MKRGRRWVTLMALGGLLIAIGMSAAYTYATWATPEAANPAPDTDLPPATAEITTGSLIQTQHVGGLLSYGEPVPLIAQGAEGILTWVPKAGEVIGLGEAAYAVNGIPVILIHGIVPPWRTLQDGVTGPDVLQLEQSLAELGYTGFVVDEIFNWETAAAASAWQTSHGMAQPWAVEPFEIAVAEGDIKIALPSLPVGSQLGGEANQTILTHTGTTQLVTVPLDIELGHLVANGDPASITLPNGEKVSGTVNDVGDVLQTIEEEQFITVIVSLDDEVSSTGFAAAPVTLEVVTAERKDVLKAPVNALIALAGGGYGVEVVANGQSSIVAVETGLFANGMVEITGEGIAEGTIVGVAA